MTKRQLIDDIRRLNRTASESFLEQFEENELDLYLRKLLRLEQKCAGQYLLRPVSLAELQT